jgi:putative transposase
MLDMLISIIAALLSAFRTRTSLQLEILALRHQLIVLHRTNNCQSRAKSLEISEVLTACRSPWQSPYVERLIGSIRRECLDQVVVMNERSLRRQLFSYFQYYHGARCHLSLGKDSPDGRAVQPPHMGKIFAVPEVGGLHHRYERRAA